MAPGNVDLDLPICRSPRLLVDVVVARDDVVLDAQQRRPDVAAVERHRVLHKFYFNQLIHAIKDKEFFAHCVHKMLIVLLKA